MAMIKVPAGKCFIKHGTAVNALYMVIHGTVRQVSKLEEVQIGSGNIIGLMDCAEEEYIADYVAADDVTLYPFHYHAPEDFGKIFISQPKYAAAFLSVAIREADHMLGRNQRFQNSTEKYYSFALAMYQKYQELCRKYCIQEKSFRRIESLQPYVRTNMAPKWEADYFHELAELGNSGTMDFFQQKEDLLTGQIMQAARAMCKAVREIDHAKEYLQEHVNLYLDTNRMDLLQLYFDMAVRAAASGADIEEIRQAIEPLLQFIKDNRLGDAGERDKRITEYQTYDFSNIKIKADAIYNFAGELIGEVPKPQAEDKLVQGTEDLLEQEYAETDGEEEEETEDCLVHILEYAGVAAEDVHKIRSKMHEYDAIPDNFDNDEKTRKLRKELTALFYATYKNVFKHAMKDADDLDPVIQMFLNFGFMDVGMVGEDTANELYDLTDKLFKCKSDHVYTMFEWLKSIYEGKNEPSRNEFDLDYNGYLAEQKRMGKLDAAGMERLKTDCWEKTKYEMDNMFVSTNRATYGKVSTFCPILSKHDMVQEAEKMLVTAERIEEAIKKVREVDYSLFYREVIFSDPMHGVNAEPVQKEVFPDVILMPNVGMKAMMWQETAGVKRDTSARFVFPVMTIYSLQDMMIETCGRFRWEMCRKIQGMRWNDITEKSLTSEYCDYIQYYRKNRDLSTEAKEKIKNTLWKSKNNYREVFISDYIGWIKYEAGGSFRLNRVARDILFRYCPFAKKYRDALEANPMYQDMISRFKIFQERKLRHIDGFRTRYEKNGGEMNMELQENMNFYNM